jgi:hypothetical protein
VSSAQIETEVDCPFCGEQIQVLVDSSQEEQSYVEDCSVCCRPIRFEVRCDTGAQDSDGGELLSIQAIKE